jgi:alkanesulfonate monooxygenase SsuD/methylene tetrahydromethanopterin reductase-like flavin-dependent oxidoreductase (luciferase family)
MATRSEPHELHLAVALEGAGWHPAAWRLASARSDELFDAAYWVDLVQTAERGTLDFVTFEDGLTLQSDHPFRPDDRVDQVRGRLDAVLLATRVAPASTHIGLVATSTTTHPEPFHVATRIASLDFVSGGRAGWRVQVMKQRVEADHFGRRDIPERPAASRSDGVDPTTRLLFEEAADAIEVARRLWDSWEDDAEIRDQPTGRFIDRDKVHYVDFDGPHFSVRGPSITPRPPQGQPVVAVLAHAAAPIALAANQADVVFITPHDPVEAADLIAQVRQTEADVGRSASALRIFADLFVLIDDDRRRAEASLADLDQLGGPLRSDALVVADTARGVADLIEGWQAVGIDGVRLRPARLPDDLDAIVDHLVPELRARGRFRSGYLPGTLRDRLGLPRPENRYRLAAAPPPAPATAQRRSQ